MRMLRCKLQLIFRVIFDIGFPPSVCNGERDRFDVKSGREVPLHKCDAQRRCLCFGDTHGDNETDGRVDLCGY